MNEQELRGMNEITEEDLAAKKKKINAEAARIRKLLKGLPKETLAASSSLIRNAAWMSVTLDELQEKINREGATSFYKNGENQFGTKKSPEVETYNTTIKNYMAAMKQLTDLLPKPEPGAPKGDSLAEFIKRDRRGVGANG